MSEIVEHNMTAGLDALIDHIKSQNEAWGAVIIRREFLHPMTNEAFVMAVRPVIQAASETHVFFISDKSLCLLWRGKQKSIYLDLRSLISTNLMLQGMEVDPAVLVGYVDPHSQGASLKALGEKKSPDKLDRRDEALIESLPDDDSGDPSRSDEPAMALRATTEQEDLYHDVCHHKSYRNNLHILIVEDQLFSQKLLCDVLRGIRLRNKSENPVIDAVQGLHEAWKIFVKKAPDITFIDLNLTDGSGHTLARAIKELDPQARVAIVTANNYEEELGVARQNNVDHFITKPYNKKQILDCVEHCVAASGLRRLK